MRVLMWPGPRTVQDNPYVALYALALEQAGFTVEDFKISEIFRRHRPDIWHIHWPESLAVVGPPWYRTLRVFAFALLVVSWKARKGALIWSIHNLAPHRPASPTLLRFLYWVVTTQVDQTLTLSETVARESRRAWPRLGSVDNHTLPHGLYPRAKPASSQDRDDLERGLGLSLDSKLIVHIGRLAEYKGSHTLPSLIPGDSKLVLAGRPESEHYLRRIREAADGRCHIVAEHISDQLAGLLYSSAKLAIFPFDAITQSGSVILALSYKCPVVVPDVPVFQELRDDFGPLVNLIDAPFSATDINRVLDELDLRATCAESPARWSWENIARITTDAYRSAIAGGRR